MKIMRWLAVVLMISSVNVLAVAVDGDAPDFSLTDLNGTVVSLSGLKGSYVVLEWFNHDCPFVKKHYGSGNMQALQKEYTGKGVIWLSICSSAPGKQGNYPVEQQKKITKDKGFNSTAVLLDEDGKVGRLYGAKTTPHMFVISPEGKVIYQGAIDSDSSADAATIQSAENYVRSALDAALAGKEVTTKSTQPYGCSVKY